MLPGVFVTSTGTDCGKTHVSRAIILAMRALQHAVAGLKPIETGCEPEPRDAIALATAAGQPALAKLPELYRAAPPLAPYAVSLQTGAAAPDLIQLARCVQRVAAAHDFTLVEGAGGLLVPVDATRSIADLAVLLDLPLLLVAPNRLGVLSHVLSAYECARARNLHVAAVILTQLEAEGAELATATNAQILAQRLPDPVLEFPHTSSEPAALVEAAHASGLIRLLCA
jgi:dethiobiotin synthetase